MFDQLGDALHVWFTSTMGPDAVDAADVAAAEAILSDDERQRHRRYVRAEDRDLFLAAHVLVRRTLSRYAPVAPQDWTFATGEHGRPEITNVEAPAGLRFNLSHTAGMTAVVVHAGVDAGVDVERIGRVADPSALARSVFADRERRALAGLGDDELALRFVQTWTSKEAFIKATGKGLAVPLQRFWIDVTDPDHPRFGCDESIETEPAAWSFTLHRPSPHHVLATACRSGEAGPQREVRLFDSGAPLLEA